MGPTDPADHNFPARIATYANLRSGATNMPDQDPHKLTPPSTPPVPANLHPQGYVRLPMSGSQFGDFIKSLLGRPQSISKTFPGTFEIEQADVDHLNCLILQRITQQNQGLLVSFSATTIYTDNSVVQLNAIDQFMTYNEPRPIAPRTLHLQWNILIHFPDKPAPEKQSIQISFVASGPTPEKIDKIVSELGTVYRSIPFDRAKGSISFRIEHTARTWGADMEALLTNHVQSLLRPPRKLKKLCSDYSPAIGLLSAILTFASAVLVTLYTSQTFSKLQMAEATRLVTSIAGTANDQIVAKLDGLTTYIATGPWYPFYFAATIFISISAFLALIMGIVMFALSDMNPYDPSFLLFTKTARQEREKALKRQNHDWLKWAAAITVDFALNILSNLAFLKFFT